MIVCKGKNVNPFGSIKRSVYIFIFLSTLKDYTCCFTLSTKRKVIIHKIKFFINFVIFRLKYKILSENSIWGLDGQDEGLCFNS